MDTQSDEDVDEDDVDDEELIRLVDQVTNDTATITDDPITVEEKVIDMPRGRTVGAEDSSESAMSGDISSEPDEMFKLVLAGNAAVGKSSFILRLCKNKFYSALNSTLGKSRDSLKLIGTNKFRRSSSSLRINLTLLLIVFFRS